jgi:hypothetical protein
MVSLFNRVLDPGQFNNFIGKGNCHFTAKPVFPEKNLPEFEIPLTNTSYSEISLVVLNTIL